MTEHEPGSRAQEHDRAARDALPDVEHRSEDPASAESSTSGVPAVDAALSEIEGVEALPLEEQLAAFERAHDRLRSALDSEPGDPA